MSNIKLSSFVNENFASNTHDLRAQCVIFANHLIQQGLIKSYHEKLTTGDMNPADFNEALGNKICATIVKWENGVNTLNHL